MRNIYNPTRFAHPFRTPVSHTRFAHPFLTPVSHTSGRGTPRAGARPFRKPFVSHTSGRGTPVSHIRFSSPSPFSQARFSSCYG